MKRTPVFLRSAAPALDLITVTRSGYRCCQNRAIPRCHSVQFSSVAWSCLTLCKPMDCRTPDLPVHCQLPEFTQTHVHLVGDAIEPSHPLSSPSPPAFSLFQRQGLFNESVLRIRRLILDKYLLEPFSISK